MTKQEAMRLARQMEVLQSLGFTQDEAEKLRRISMTLRRWHEKECGTDNGCIERDETTGKAYWLSSMSGKRYPVRDDETGARRRLAAIMAKHDGNHCHRCDPYALQPCGKYCGHVVGKLSAYVQGDPRGAALYIIRPGDVPQGASVDSCYSRGICVY